MNLKLILIYLITIASFCRADSASDDYKNGNRYIKKALESEIQDGSNLKSLLAYTGIINGEIAQGCSDLTELIIEGTIKRVDLEIIPIDDICIFPY